MSLCLFIEFTSKYSRAITPLYICVITQTVITHMCNKTGCQDCGSALANEAKTTKPFLTRLPVILGALALLQCFTFASSCKIITNATTNASDKRHEISIAVNSNKNNGRGNLSPVHSASKFGLNSINILKYAGCDILAFILSR